MRRTMIGCIAGKPVDPQTVLLMHCDGANDSTTFVDDSVYGKALTAAGNAKLTTANKKFGTAAVTWDGAGDSITIPSSADFAFGTGDFTVEMWIYVNSWTSDATLFIVNSVNGFQLGRRGTGTTWGVAANATAWRLEVAGLPSTGAWHHIAVTRAGTTMRIFLDGTVVATGTVTDNFTQGAVSIGSSNYFGLGDELRVSKGIARQTSNFTPSAEAYLT